MIDRDGARRPADGRVDDDRDEDEESRIGGTLARDGDHYLDPDTTFIESADGERRVRLADLISSFKVMGGMAVEQTAQVSDLIAHTRVVEARHAEERETWRRERELLVGQLAILEAAGREKDVLLAQKDDELAKKDARIEELETNSSIDKTTGLGSKLALDARKEKLNEDIQADRKPREAGEPRRRRMKLTYVTLDLDGFKDANDATDWDTANVLLGILGRNLRDNLRESQDGLYRPYGDDAVIVMPGVALKADEQESLRQRIDALGKEAYEEFISLLDADGNYAEAVAKLRKMRLTGYSVGFSVYNPRRHSSIEEMEAESIVEQKRQKALRREAAGLTASGRATIANED